MAGHHFLQDGRERAIKGIREEVRRAVEAEYASRLVDAGPWQQAYLKLRMSREISKRVQAEIERLAPHDGMYFHK